MPFTFSHAVAVLPFLKNKKLSASALIVGSFSPDLEYFFRMKMQSEISHTLLGIFILDLPLGLLVLFLFHAFVKQNLLTNVPSYIQSRTQELQSSNWILYCKQNSGLVIISFVLGAFSHLVWDSMTHYDGYVVRHFDFLNSEFYHIPLYSFNQYISSVLGLLVLAIFFAKQPVSKVAVKAIQIQYWIVVGATALLVFAARWAVGIKEGDWATLLVSAITATFIGFVMGGLLFKKQLKH